MNWKLDAQGNMSVLPVGGWEAAAIGGKALALRLDFFRTPGHLDRSEMEQEQYLLTPEQALALADTLRRGAERLGATPGTGS